MNGLNEAARFYNAYEVRFTTVGDILADAQREGSKSQRDAAGRRLGQTLRWKDVEAPRYRGRRSAISATRSSSTPLPGSFT